MLVDVTLDPLKELEFIIVIKIGCWLNSIWEIKWVNILGFVIFLVLFATVELHQNCLYLGWNILFMNISDQLRSLVLIFLFFSFVKYSFSLEVYCFYQYLLAHVFSFNCHLLRHQLSISIFFVWPIFDNKWGQHTEICLM